MIEAGFKAQQMNALINVKTAEKGLQFGVRKCKTMLIGKDTSDAIVGDLTVDKWKVTHEDVPGKSTDEIMEIYEGEVTIDRVEEQRYLGFVLSNTGNNMVNINHIKKKAKGTIRRIFNRLNSLNLQKYYFECAIVFMNTMLRCSILFACETYYNLKESELRQLERIEEGFLRELLKTSTGCPITQLYLEVGQYPARYEIFKIRILYLKYILNQDQDGMLYKFFQIQLKSPSKRDWVTECLKNLKDLEIELSLEEIQTMPYLQFKTMLNLKIKKAALLYLTQKQKSKGGDIQYSELRMSEYLLPNNEDLSIENKQKTFSIRNKMVNIPANFSSRKTEYKCWCGNNEDMKHIYLCKMLNLEEPEPGLEYEQIYSNNIKKIREINKRFQQNMKKRQELKETEIEEEEKMKNIKFPPRDPLCDPLYLVYSNG